MGEYVQRLSDYFVGPVIGSFLSGANRGRQRNFEK
jgi:hypothetical protein